MLAFRGAVVYWNGKPTMTQNTFIEKIAQELSVGAADLTPDTVLSSLPSWDSLGKMGVLALIDFELHVVVPQGSLQNCHKVSDLLSLVGANLSRE